MRIKKIRIENFRGIKSVLDFSFKKGSTYTSLVIYGKNGTGKSSIVDAWEWLYSQKIVHLAREGAGEKDYPHKDSDGSNSYIEVDVDQDMDTIRMQYDKNRVTQPIISGDLTDFKKFFLFEKYNNS
jgi:DNA repair exonuclease SbcCD ATPase subunit